MAATVLDSFALIAYFRGEPASVPVKELLQRASKADKPVQMTEVNYAEAKYKSTIRAQNVARTGREATSPAFSP